MKSQSVKICQYCSIEFKGTSAQKFCESHKNKICRVCKNLKEQEISNNWRSLCRKCESNRTLKYIKNKKELNPDFFKTEKIRLQKKSQRKKYVEKYPEKIKSYYAQNKDKIKQQQKERYVKNKISICEKGKKWRIENKKRHTESCIKAVKKFNKLNPHIIAWRNCLYRVLRYKNIKKTSKTEIALGYTASELKLNIESKFKNGMSWDNYGEWHIDHIIPVTFFNKNEDVKIINSLNNLNPLWAAENLKKGNKIKN